MKYKIPKKLFKPKDYRPYSLFEFVVNIIVQKINSKYPLPDEFRTHRQWACLIFGSGNSIGNKYLSRVTSNYGTYMIIRGTKYKWDLEKIKLEHPNFFITEDSSKQKRDIYREFTLAIDDEIVQAKEEKQKNTYQVLSLEIFKVSKSEQVYVAELELDSDDEPKFSEGLPIQIKVGGLEFDGKVLEFDKILSKLYFDCISPLLNYTGSRKIIMDTVWLLEKIKDRIQEIDKEKIVNYPLNKFIASKCYPEKKYSVEKEWVNNNEKLDASQKAATIKSIENDVSLIWGPPGTGKSHTLSYILADFFRSNEKTLVCCIANVAVDALTKKLTELIEKTYEPDEFKNGSLLRLGYTRDRELIRKDYLFPRNQRISELREIISEREEYLQKNECSKQERIGIRKVIQDKRQDLKEEIDKLIGNAKLLFATASKVHVDSNIYELEFENLIIDEASMMSVPHFVALAKNITKRIIVTGDFRQLGPIVLSQTQLSRKWLNKDIFEFGGVKTKETEIQHKALSQLLVQRRSHEKICELINRPFYQGKLISDPFFDNQKVIDVKPYKGRVITYIDLGKDPSYVVQRTKKGSRYNEHSANEIISIIAKYFKSSSTFTLGVITPYRGQVRLLSEGVERLKFPSSKKQLVKIGTIHAFQGSESDIIIFDLVDSRHLKIGRLYQHDTGKRLINVALSRAKSKLIVIGDLGIFQSGTGSNNVAPAILSIVNNLRRYGKN